MIRSSSSFSYLNEAISISDNNRKINKIGKMRVTARTLKRKKFDNMDAFLHAEGQAGEVHHDMLQIKEIKTSSKLSYFTDILRSLLQRLRMSTSSILHCFNICFTLKKNANNARENLHSTHYLV